MDTTPPARGRAAGLAVGAGLLGCVAMTRVAMIGASARSDRSD